MARRERSPATGAPAILAPWTTSSESTSIGCARFSATRTDGTDARIDERFERAGRDARAIIAQIAAQVNPRRIYQWGSLLDRARFSEISDIDIAVEGLRGPAEYFRTLGIAMEGTTLPVDVVELERVPAEIAERIRTRGALVHERHDP